MKQIEQTIGDLLLRHNCVIVPSFGGFVAEQLSAKIDYKKGVMLPPRKALLFNKQLVSNDGLLINELASRNAISFDKASSDVASTVSEWKHRLEKGERIELDRVGILYHDADNNLRFEQDRFFNLLLASFGLDQVHFVTQNEIEEVQAEPIKIEPTVIEPALVEVEEESAPIKHLPKTFAVEKAEQEETETTKVVEMIPAKKKKRVWRYVAAACFLPVLFYSFWIPARTDVLQSGMLSIRDFNPFYESKEGTYQQTSYPEDIAFNKYSDRTLQDQIDDVENVPADNVISYNFDGDTYIRLKLDKPQPAEVATEDVVSDEITETPVAIQPNAMNYIVGCFGNKENAENLVEKLKSEGMNAYIYDVKGGLHRVSAGSAISTEAMSDIRSKSETLGFSGWILK